MSILDVLKKPSNSNQEVDLPLPEVTKELSADEKAQEFRKKTALFNKEQHGEGPVEEVVNASDIFVNRSQQVKICKPKVYEDAERIGQAIKEEKVVILHMEDLDSETATRILEFVYGICFYAGIEPENIDSKIFMIDPQHQRNK